MYNLETEDIENMEYALSLENAKDYDIPNVGDIVTVHYDKENKDEQCIVIRTDYTVDYVMGEDIKSKHPVMITGWNYRKSIKHQEIFHVCHVTKIIHRPEEYSSESFVDDWQQYVNKMIKSQKPEIGKTAIILHNSIIRIADRRLGKLGRNDEKRSNKKYKIIGIKYRDVEPLLILKPTKHFNRKYVELSLGHCYLS